MSYHSQESDPANVVRLTQSVASEPGDSADAADRLTMIMEAEAIRNGMNGDSGEFGGEGSLEGLLYPLQDSEYELASDDGQDSSDDPTHAGGITPAPLVSGEVAAMHFIDTDEYVDEETDENRADPQFDQFEAPAKDLTPEDETLLGVDPYDD